MRRGVKQGSQPSMTALQPYPAYKDSRIDWLGEVPEHWEVRRLKDWLAINRRVLPEDTDPEYAFAYLDIGSVATGRLTAIPERIRFGNAPSRARRIVAHGDTIISTVRTYLKAVWHANNPMERLIASTGFAVLTPGLKTDPRFVSYICQSDPFTDRVTSESVGIAYPAIAETRLGTFSVCVPPLPEQTAIARFLDHADGRIQRYIRAQERLIELLEEQKQAMTYQAVTGQIDVRTGQPYPAYKDSEVEWLGKVPEHWEVRKVGSLFRCKGSGTTPPSDRFFGGGFPWIMSGDLNDGVVSSTARSVTDEALERFSALKTYPPGSLVVAMYGATIGRTAILSMRACTNQACFVAADPFFGTNVEFAQAVLVSSRKELIHRSYGGSQPNISAEVLKRFRVPSPPGSEQRAIVAYLRNGVASLDAAEKGCRRLEGLARAYRTRLIADVVTGKLDVREAVANLPEAEPVTTANLPDTNHTEPHPDATEHDMAKEAIT